MNHRSLIIFARFPTPGETKTRLIPALGKEGASRLQRQMTEHILRNIHAPKIYNTVIYYNGENESSMQDWLGSDKTYVRQIEGSIGARMLTAFKEIFHNTNTSSAVLIGSDCPSIDSKIITHAFDQLEKNDLVFGPSTDGGYYLVGMNRKTLQKGVSQLFEDTIPWSTDMVFSETVKRIKNLSLSFGETHILTDIDEPKDLPLWEEAKRKDSISQAQPKISIIIPTLNESKNIEETLKHAGLGENIEIIVADGGSVDSTISIAKNYGAKTVHSEKGRSAQSNLGANKSNGDILLFLHADTLLPLGYDTHIRSLLLNQNIAGGAFLLRINDTQKKMRAIEILTNLRSKILRLPYGDQGIFIRKNIFEMLGGFPSMPIMEDFAFMRTLKRKNLSIAIADSSVTTSARRWSKLGVFKTTLINQVIIIAYYLGISPSTLASWYRGKKK